MQLAKEPAHFGHVASYAREALACVMVALDTFRGIPIIAESERSFACTLLLHSSIDYGRGMLTLLKGEPEALSAVALGMHRSQIETFLRGAFVGKVAVEDELKRFLDGGDISRRSGDGKLERMSTKQLAEHVQRVLETTAVMDNQFKLVDFVRSAWSPLCGVVHGGKELRDMYHHQDGRIGAGAPIPLLFENIEHAVQIALYCVTVAVLSSGVPQRDELHNGLQAVWKFMHVRESLMQQVQV
jgi:hypothetical protein